MAANEVRIPANRLDEEGDWLVKQMFSKADLALSPEEYAARHAHEWACFAYHRYRYRDSDLGAWVRRFGEIFDSESELERCRQRFLTPEEYAEVKRQVSEDF